MKNSLKNLLLLLLPLAMVTSACEEGPLAVDRLVLMNMEGEEVESLSPSDQEYKVGIRVNNMGSDANVRMELTAVETTAGNNEMFLEQDYTLSGMENNVEFSVTFPNEWPVGSYRVDAYLNDSLARSLDFMIE